jgi:hypothetical protein
VNEYGLFFAGIYIGGAVVSAIAAHLGYDETDSTTYTLLMVFGWPILLPVIIIADAWEAHQNLKKGTPRD